MTATIVGIDPLFADREVAASMVRLCERFGSYRMYSTEHVESEIGNGLAQRHDAVANFLRTGGRYENLESTARLAARTNYFREEYAYGDRVLIDGIEPFLAHDGFVAAARQIHGREVIEPAIVYANLLVPGQELTVHTDVPEFRGANRKLMPQWLVVAMHHSGLFDEHRMPIATGVAWFGDGDGGEFAVYPDGADQPGVAYPVRFNTAMVLDTDSVFHAVDPVARSHATLPELTPDMTLGPVSDGTWAVSSGDTEVARWDWGELRFSISWKAYCFESVEERDAWQTHDDDLSVESVLATLRDDLADRGRLTGDTTPRDLALMIIDTYIRFPTASARADRAPSR